MVVVRTIMHICVTHTSICVFTSRSFEEEGLASSTLASVTLFLTFPSDVARCS